MGWFKDKMSIDTSEIIKKLLSKGYTLDRDSYGNYGYTNCYNGDYEDHNKHVTISFDDMKVYVNEDSLCGYEKGGEFKIEKVWIENVEHFIDGLDKGFEDLICRRDYK